MPPLPMIDSSMRAAELSERLEPLRHSVAQAVKRDGPAEHQVAIDHMSWRYAHSEAAIALLQWADFCSDSGASALAEIAYRQAIALTASDVSAESIDILKAGLVDRVTHTEDLGATDEHRLLRATIRIFASRLIQPRANQIPRLDLDIPDQVIRGVADLGLFGMSIPAEYGGSQPAENFLAMLIATEELSTASLAVGGSLITRPEILVRALLRAGTEPQKRKWLPSIASGEKLVAVAVTEPDHGSDVGAIQCRATLRASGDWVINGTKLWCTFAGRSELIMVLCRTADTGHRGLSVFVVEKPRFDGHEFEFRQPDGGTLRGRAIPTIGYRGMHTFDLSFEALRLPPDALVGGEEWLNRGFYLQMEGFAIGRIQTAGRAVGLMQAAVDDSLAYARSRRAFGGPIATNQLIKSKLGNSLLLLNASRQLSYRAARLLNAGGGQTEAALAKLYASRAAEIVTREAMQVHGAMGYSEEMDVSRYFVDARVLTIFEGAEEILSLRVVGKALLEQSN